MAEAGDEVVGGEACHAGEVIDGVVFFGVGFDIVDNFAEVGVAGGGGVFLGG